MLVLVNGLPLFSKRLVKDLNSLDKKNTYFFADTYYSSWQKIRFLLLLPFCKIVISFNGVSDQSGSLNWVLRFKKKMMMQWQGTDVLLAVERFKMGSIQKKYIDNAIHFTDAPWLKDELKEIAPNIRILNFKHLEFQQNSTQYKNQSVLSYMGKGRENFYGFQAFKYAAEKFPTVAFHIIGSDGKGLESLPNITFHGWVSEDQVKRMMIETPIFVRLVEHDGNSISVIEALGNGCEVIWSYPNENCFLAKTGNELAQVLKDVMLLVENRNNLPNEENYLFVKENYQKEYVIGNYIKEINEFANKK
jgi:hypothetical protein